MTYQPIIGLEVHVELSTKSGMFCGCPTNHFGKPPNTNTCPVCLGLPGALPVPNKKAIEWTIKLGLALGCQINRDSKFDRKNYFYPDLPKGYQISQYDQPLCVSGNYLGINIRRVHLEEDTGKLIHQGDTTLVDFNRSGVPLAEIVTEPDFRSLDQVDAFLKKLQRLVRYLDISNADMEKGSMRIEPNISLTSDGKLPNYRVELKNINSFRFVRKALEFEIERQQKDPHIQQTRGWSEEKNATVPQREKEEAHDYRYFPEPDIPPMHFDSTFINQLRKQIPELPEAKLERFLKVYGLNSQQAGIFVETHEVAKNFEETVKLYKKDFSAQEVANLIINKRPLVTKSQVEPPDELIKKVISANVKAANDYKSGTKGALGPLIGAVLIHGDFDKQLVIAKLKKHLLN